MTDPLMSPAEFHDHQRRAERWLSEHEALMRYRESVQKALQDAEVIEGDNSPYSDILKALAWAIGAGLAILAFTVIAFWAYAEWQPKLDLSYKGPAHYSRSGK